MLNIFSMLDCCLNRYFSEISFQNFDHVLTGCLYLYCWLLRFFILYSRASSLFYAWFPLLLSIAKQSFKFWSPVYQFFLLQTLLLSANLVCLDFLLCLSYKFYILSPPSIWSHFCIRTCVKNIYIYTYIYIYIFFACGFSGCPIPPAPFVEKAIFLHYFGFFVKNQLSIFMWGYL